MKKRILSAFLAICLVVTLLPTLALASEATFSDMPSDYSTAALKAAVSNGLLKGSDGKILPNDPLTRAQMAAIIVRAFGATEEALLTGYTDVSSAAWYYKDLGKAVKMKVLQGDGVRLNPEDTISRQQAFAVLARALKLKDGTSADLSGFSDKSSVASWAVGTTAAMVNAGFIQGSNGKLNPTANISRKDFAVMMNNIFKTYVNSTNAVTELAAGTVLINVPGTSLKDVTVKGDLIIGDGVGNGDVTLDNVIVTGRMIVRGGGVNSIIIRGNSSVGEVVVSKVDGNVRIAVEGGANVEIVYINDGKDDVIVEGSVDKLVIDAPSVPVTIKGGTVGEVSVNSNNATVMVDKTATVTFMTASGSEPTLTVQGTVKTLTATAGATGATIEVAKGGAVDTVNAGAPDTAISGEGSVKNANVTGNNVSVDTKGTEVKVSEGVTGTTAGGNDVKPGETANTGTGTTGGSPGGGGGGGSSVAVSAISVNKEATVLAVGLTETLVATVLPSNATNKAVTWTSSNTDVATVNSNGLITAVAEGTATITATTVDGSKTATTIVTVVKADTEFIPGEGGAIKAPPVFEAEVNKIGGLYIDKNHDYYFHIYGGHPLYHHSIEMKFLPPSHFGATSYKLQYSEDDGVNWKDYLDLEGIVISISENQDNITVADPSSTTTMYRLLVIGGTKGGYTSNTVTAKQLVKKTKFTGWSLDEGVHVSGVMYPWVGRGLEASFTAEIQILEGENIVYTNEHMNYQWYRVNPVSYEMIAIPGATNLKYITTNDDIGYNLLVRATGDDETISGFTQIMIENAGLLEQNNAYINNITDTGFTLNLYKSVPELKVGDLILTDYERNSVTINGVTQGKNAAIYNVSANLDRANGPFYLSNSTEFWSIASSPEEGHLRQEVVVPYAPEAREVNLEIPAEEASPYHIDVIVTNASTSEPITGLVKEDFMITFGESGSYPIDMLDAGGMYGDKDGHYTLYPNEDVDVYCPVIGYDVRIPVGSYTLEFSKDGYQDASISFEIVVTASTDASITGITVKDTAATVDGSDATIYNVELAAGTVLSELVATDVVATVTDSKATVAAATTTDNGATWTVAVTAEDETITKTYTINVTVAANADQAAPIGLAGVAPTSASSDDGKITGTTTAMEYKLASANDWITVTGTEITDLAAGDYEVRYAAKTGYNAGTAANVIVGAYVKSKDASITGITVKDTAAVVDGSDPTIYHVELARGTVLSTLVPGDIEVTATDTNATVASAVTTDGGLTWTVDVTAEDGTTVETYTINITVVEVAVSKLTSNYYATGETLTFTISNLKPNEVVKVGMPINTGAGGNPWASDEKVISGMTEEGSGENLVRYFKGTTDSSGVLTVSGTVQADLPSGVLHITLPDYGYTIDNAIELQDNQGQGVRVGAPVFNQNTNIAYSTIQAAINATETEDGHTIIVEAGTYDEELSITDKSLTLNGVDGTILTRGIIAATEILDKTLTISGIEFETYGLEVKGYDDVTISDNKFADITEWRGTQATINVKNAIFVHGSTAGKAVITNNIINGVKYESNGDGIGIMVLGLDDITISNNSISDTYHNSINLYGGIAGTVAITNNTLSNWDSNKDVENQEGITEKGGRALRINLDEAATINVNGNTFMPNDHAAPVDPDYVKITGYAGNVSNFIYSLVENNNWPTDVDYSTVILVNTTKGSSDLSNFTVSITPSGDKIAGEFFELSITGAKDTSGNNLSGVVKVTVVSDQTDEGASLYDDNVTFADGAATIPPIALTTVTSHTLTVTIDGVTNAENLSVTVNLSQAVVSPISAEFANTDISATITITELVNAVGTNVLADFVSDAGTSYKYSFINPENPEEEIGVTVTKDAASDVLVISSVAIAAGEYHLVIMPTSGGLPGWGIVVTVTGD